MAAAASKALLLFADAARSAAAATYRVARLAERRALRLSPGPEPPAVAASHTSRLSGGRSSAAVPTHGTVALAPRPAMDAHAPSPRTGSSKDLSKPGGRVEVVQKEEDLASDEALWDLYERWCKAFNQKREPDEMARRFNKFKKRVLDIHRMNNADNQSRNKVGLTLFSDGKLPRGNRDDSDLKLEKKYGDCCLTQSSVGKYLKQVFADFDVVNGKLFVWVPLEKGKRQCEKKEINAEFEVIFGRLYADLPEGHELQLKGLLLPTPEMLLRRYPPYLG